MARRRQRTSLPELVAFEDSITGEPNPVTCEPDLPGDIYLSAEMSGEEQAALVD